MVSPLAPPSRHIENQQIRTSIVELSRVPRYNPGLFRPVHVVCVLGCDAQSAIIKLDIHKGTRTYGRY
ncbi:MAG: hypothetical protein K0Q74_1508 [Gammaproteobacteria bacterium]|jgi:hypothetical protein|nr:hypothetical protein [Gammaproteobacteria bacterium]